MRCACVRPYHPLDPFGVDVSPDLASKITAAALEEIAIWRARLLESICSLVGRNALRARPAPLWMTRCRSIDGSRAGFPTVSHPAGPCRSVDRR
jgi:hypothetical protein